MDAPEERYPAAREWLAVTSFDAEGPWLYVGGRVTHIGGGRRTNPAYTRMAESERPYDRA
mgnify:CR=1 FL=1